MTILRRKNKTSTLQTSFAAALTATLLAPAVVPDLPLHYFCPLIALAFYRTHLISCLWLALVCGLVMDLIASHHHMGIHSIAYCGSAALIYRYKRHLFEDKITTLPIMAFLFSALNTCIAATLYGAFEASFTWSWQWIICDVVLMPLLDGILTICCVMTVTFVRRGTPIAAEEMVGDPSGAVQE
ncbi:Uncharacterized protein SCG7086_BX_00020 [Chlamydiales bacterium SCGC AG-110-P3]|nr:Uncharacterized protein SCG7086_BX_00020 [Chlamydiales bacterium SCGC AG-110-P3]